LQLTKQKIAIPFTSIVYVFNFTVNVLG